MTMEPGQPDLLNGDVHFDNGLIVDVGTGLAAPSAQIIDGARLHRHARHDRHPLAHVDDALAVRVCASRSTVRAMSAAAGVVKIGNSDPWKVAASGNAALASAALDGCSFPVGGGPISRARGRVGASARPGGFRALC